MALHFASASYYMGETDTVNGHPCISYDETYVVLPGLFINGKSTELTNEQLDELFGIKIIRFEFSEPIENTFDVEVANKEEASQYKNQSSML